MCFDNKNEGKWHYTVPAMDKYSETDTNTVTPTMDKAFSNNSNEVILLDYESRVSNMVTVSAGLPYLESPTW